MLSLGQLTFGNLETPFSRLGPSSWVRQLAHNRHDQPDGSRSSTTERHGWASIFGLHGLISHPGGWMVDGFARGGLETAKWPKMVEVVGFYSATGVFAYFVVTGQKKPKR